MSKESDDIIHILKNVSANNAALIDKLHEEIKAEEEKDRKLLLTIHRDVLATQRLVCSLASMIKEMEKER